MPEAAPYNESSRGESGWGSCARLPSPPDQWRLQNAPRSLGQVGFISLTFREAAVTCPRRGLALQTHLSLIHLRPSFVPESLPQRSQPLREPEIARPLSSTSWLMGTAVILVFHALSGGPAAEGAGQLGGVERGQMSS